MKTQEQIEGAVWPMEPAVGEVTEPGNPTARTAYQRYADLSGVLLPQRISNDEIIQTRADGIEFSQTGHESPERAQLNQEAFEYAFTQYAVLSSWSRQSDGVMHSSSPFRGRYGCVGDDVLVAFSSSPESALSRIRDNAALVEALGPNDAIPDQTIAMPVAINSEDPSTVLRAVREVKRSQRGSDRLTELIIWANARFDESESEVACREQAERGYETLKQLLDELDVDEARLQIKTALQVGPADEMTMSKIRRNKMDAIIAICHAQQRGFNHPVVWLDADVENMSNLAVDTMSIAASRLESSTVHANTRFSAGFEDELQGGCLREVDDINKAPVLREVFRRKIERHRLRAQQAIGLPMKPVGNYIEECGLGFAAGVYMMVGGLDTDEPMSESPSILERIQVQSTIPTFAPRDSSVVRQYLLGTSLENIVDLDAFEGEDVESLNKDPFVKWLQAKITVSGRGMQRSVIDSGYEAAASPFSHNYPGLYTHRKDKGFDSGHNSWGRVDAERLLRLLTVEDEDIAPLYKVMPHGVRIEVMQEMDDFIAKFYT